jgi:hypothetical protein
VSPQLGSNEEKKKGKISQGGPWEEVIPGGKAGQPNITSKGDICVDFLGSTCRQKRAIGRS